MLAAQLTQGRSWEAQCINLFNPDEVRRKIGPFAEEGDFEIDEKSLSSEEGAWRRRLRKILDDPRNPSRRLVIADQKMISDIAALELQSPHFRSVIGLIVRAAKLSCSTQSPLLIPPLLLTGGPGVGKTFFARGLAEAIGTRIEHVSADLLSDRGSLTGLSMSWRAARSGRIANALLESPTASPVMLIDEIDKVSAIHQHEKPLAFLHTTLKSQNARRFQDEYLTFAMRADHMIWIMTANSTDGLAASILDRLIVFCIEKPPDDVASVVTRSIYAEVNARCANAFSPEVREDIIRCLLATNARHVRKLLELAFGYAIEADRDFLLQCDIQNAHDVLRDHIEKCSIGFI